MEATARRRFVYRRMVREVRNTRPIDRNPGDSSASSFLERADGMYRLNRCLRSVFIHSLEIRFHHTTRCARIKISIHKPCPPARGGGWKTVKLTFLHSPDRSDNGTASGGPSRGNRRASRPVSCVSTASDRVPLSPPLRANPMLQQCPSPSSPANIGAYSDVHEFCLSCFVERLMGTATTGRWSDRQSTGPGSNRPIA